MSIKSRANCPVCGIPMRYYDDVLDGHCLIEESENCETGHYSYHYITGVTEVMVGNKYLVWNRHTPFVETERINKIIDRMIEKYKLKNGF